MSKEPKLVMGRSNTTARRTLKHPSSNVIYSRSIRGSSHLRSSLIRSNENALDKVTQEDKNKTLGAVTESLQSQLSSQVPGTASFKQSFEAHDALLQNRPMDAIIDAKYNGKYPYLAPQHMESLQKAMSQTFMENMDHFHEYFLTLFKQSKEIAEKTDLENDAPGTVKTFMKSQSSRNKNILSAFFPDKSRQSIHQSKAYTVEDCSSKQVKIEDVDSAEEETNKILKLQRFLDKNEPTSRDNSSRQSRQLFKPFGTSDPVSPANIVNKQFDRIQAVIDDPSEFLKKQEEYDSNETRRYSHLMFAKEFLNRFGSQSQDQAFAQLIKVVGEKFMRKLEVMQLKQSEIAQQVKLDENYNKRVEMKLLNKYPKLTKIPDSQLKKDSAEQLIIGDSEEKKMIRRQEQRIRDLLEESNVQLVDRLLMKEEQLRRQRKTYFDELMQYRMLVSVPKNNSQFRHEMSQIKVKLFDETEGLDPEIKQMLNDRISEVMAQYKSYVQRDEQNNIVMRQKLEKFEKLPQDRKFLANMKIEEVFQAIAILEPDAYQVWSHIENVFNEIFLEPVVFQKYGYLFDEQSETVFKEKIEEIRTEIADQIVEMKVGYDKVLLREREDRESIKKRAEQLENKLTYLQETCQKAAIAEAKSVYQMKLESKQRAWENERTELVEQLRDLRYLTEQSERKQAKTRLNAFVQLWLLHSKFQKWRRCDPQSKDYVEITAKLDHELRANLTERVRVQVQSTQHQLETAQYKINEQKEELVKLRFENSNLSKQVAQLKDTIEIKDEQLSFRQTQLDNLKLENNTLILENQELNAECDNFRDISSSLQTKVQQLKKRVADYGVQPPDSKLDKKLLCNHNFKKMEGNLLVNQVLEAIRVAMLDTVKRVGMKKTEDVGVITDHLKDVEKRIVYDYNFGKSEITHSSIQCHQNDFDCKYLQAGVQTQMLKTDVLSKNNDLPKLIELTKRATKDDTKRRLAGDVAFLKSNLQQFGYGWYDKTKSQHNESSNPASAKSRRENGLADNLVYDNAVNSRESPSFVGSTNKEKLNAMAKKRRGTQVVSQPTDLSTSANQKSKSKGRANSTESTWSMLRKLNEKGGLRKRIMNRNSAQETVGAYQTHQASVTTAGKGKKKIEREIIFGDVSGYHASMKVPPSHQTMSSSNEVNTSKEMYLADIISLKSGSQPRGTFKAAALIKKSPRKIRRSRQKTDVNCQTSESGSHTEFHNLSEGCSHQSLTMEGALNRGNSLQEGTEHTELITHAKNNSLYYEGEQDSENTEQYFNHVAARAHHGMHLSNQFETELVTQSEGRNACEDEPPLSNEASGDLITQINIIPKEQSVETTETGSMKEMKYKEAAVGHQEGSVQKSKTKRASPNHKRGSDTPSKTKRSFINGSYLLINGKIKHQARCSTAKQTFKNKQLLLLNLQKQRQMDRLQHQKKSQSSGSTTVGTQSTTNYNRKRTHSAHGKRYTKRQSPQNNQKSMRPPAEWKKNDVFNRLWSNQADVEAKREEARSLSRQSAIAEWQEKMANSNTLDQFGGQTSQGIAIKGMPVYADRQSGRYFIHLNDLKQKINAKPQIVNNKESYSVQQSIKRRNSSSIEVAAHEFRSEEANPVDTQILQMSHYMEPSSTIQDQIAFTDLNGVTRNSASVISGTLAQQDPFGPSINTMLSKFNSIQTGSQEMNTQSQKSANLIYENV